MAAGSRNKRARRIHLILDNAAIHDSRKTRAALEQLRGRIILHFLPPYCPEENRIERRWLDLHGNVTRNHTSAWEAKADGYVSGKRYAREHCAS